MIGQTLGHYEIVEKLGEGGMGVVYKARDAHLDRFVAIKVLPADKVADPDRRRRFEQEAKSASALNHPNIITIYDIDTAAGRDFIAMEYVPGRTLAELIERGRLPPAEVMKYAVQISDALGAAHVAGIVHRDLKPANVLVTEKGLVKLLDFGLAKLTEPTPGSDPALTVTAQPRTEPGLIVGTVAYMSPEQAEGKKVDARSDIFSFGVVLYEMVTGRRPFAGETGPSTLAAILAKEPEPPSRLVSEVPPELERIVLRCLRKDPQRRWQAMADLAVALEDLKEEVDSGKVSAVAGAPARPARRGRMLVGVLGLVALAAAAAGGWWFWRRAAVSTPAPVAYELERLTFDSASAFSPAISPDGNLIAYASDRAGSFSLYLRQFGARQAIQMTGQDSTAWYPSFSPDGLKIFYRSERDGGGLYVRDALAGPGGAEMKLVDGGETPAVSPAGTSVAYLVPAALAGRAALFVVPGGGGTARRVAPDLSAVWPASSGGHQPPVWSPDSRNVLLRGMRGSDPKTLGLWVASLAEDNVEAIQGVPACPVWFARYVVAWRGEFLYYVDGEPINGSTLYRVHLTPGPWRATGSPEKLASFAGVALSASVSARGRMVLPILTFEPNLWSAGLQPGKGTSEGPLEAVTVDSNGKRRLSVAANGSRLAYSTYGPPGQGNVEVRLRDLATGRESLIAGSGDYPFLDPVLSPDGSKVAYADRREAKLVTYVAESGSTAGQIVCEDCRVRGFFPGSSEVLVQVRDQLSRRRLNGNGETPLLRNPDLGEMALSPDGARLAFTQARLDGSAALYEVDLTRPADRPDSWVLVAEDRRHVGSPAWSSDGRLLYYVSQRDGSPCVWVQPFDVDGRPAGPASAALHLHSGNGVVGRMTTIGVTHDRLFLLLTRIKGDIWSIELER